MHHLCSLSPQTPLPTTGKNCFLIFNPISKSDNHDLHGMSRRISSLMQPRRGYYLYRRWIISAMDNESKFELDPDKARQALTELDQQLESLSVKRVNPPKIRASSIGNLKEQVKNEPPEITGSFLGYIAFVLFVFSIFYNILFITVIKPSIDGPDEDIVPTNVTTSYQAPDVSQPLQ